MITALLIYIAGVILAYILGAIWNDYLQKWLNLDKSWEIYPTSLCVLSFATVIIWILFTLGALLSKLTLHNLPTFKKNKK